MPGDDDFAAWFRLLETPGVGREAARRLLAGCGSPQAVFAADAAAWRELTNARVAAALAIEPAEYARRLAVARAWLAASPQHHWLSLDSPHYPARLLHTADPPLLLYLQGRPEALAGDSLAVVGSRQATAQGRDNARAFAHALAAEGCIIVSGLAAGIDAAAHEGALSGAPEDAAATVAVVGTGLDSVYPARHAALARRIAERGAIVSEYAPGTPPLAENFPPRNRIIAGLSRGTLVVEAALRSGSLITARLAAEAGREVFAVPGSIHAPQSRGCHALIRQGATLVESAEDVLAELRGSAGGRAGPATGPPAPPAPDDGPEDPLLAALGHDPATLDALQARTGESTARLTARLLELELEGRVARLPGGLYQRRGHG